MIDSPFTKAITRGESVRWSLSVFSDEDDDGIAEAQDMRYDTFAAGIYPNFRDGATRIAEFQVDTTHAAEGVIFVTMTADETRKLIEGKEYVYTVIRTKNDGTRKSLIDGKILVNGTLPP